MSLAHYNKRQLIEAIIHSDTPENVKDYQESGEAKADPSIDDLAVFYLGKHAQEFYDKNQTLLNLNEHCSS